MKVKVCLVVMKSYMEYQRHDDLFLLKRYSILKPHYTTAGQFSWERLPFETTEVERHSDQHSNIDGA